MGRRGFTLDLAKKNGLAVDRYPLTDEEVRKAEDALAADLEKLSLVEQEKLVFDIHGLRTTSTATISSINTDIAYDGENDGEQDHNNKQDEEDQNEETLLKAVEEEIRKIGASINNNNNDNDYANNNNNTGNATDRKSAYEHAKYLNPEYVEGRDLRLRFLRCNDYDPSLAADQIVQHFDTKRKLFGSGNILGRPILFSDLTEGAVKFLQIGSCQILQSRDAAGRVVAFMAPGYTDFDDDEISMEDSHRASWYFQQIISTEDESVSKDGFVLVNYNLGKYGAIITDIEVMKDLYNNAYDGSPLKMTAGHFCYDDTKMRNYLPGATLFGDENGRHRLRCHFGTDKADVLFKLQTYGIPTDDFPINDAETLELDFHLQWLESQKKREANTISSSAAKNKHFYCLIPRRFDVLFGRGTDTRVHTGNLRALHLVEMEFATYEEASKLEKTAIAARIVTRIQESYGRFLKWDDDEGGWVEVDFDTARNKVSHFFRRRRLRQKNEESTSGADVHVVDESKTSN